MHKTLEALLSVVLTLCAVAVAVVVVRAQLAPARPITTRISPPIFEERWESLLPDALWIGRPQAALRLVVFSDYECPFCKTFFQAAHQVVEESGGTVALAYRHYPLQMHRFATGAARASDCAAAQGRFAEISEALFSGQDSIGLLRWQEYARRAGVPDSLEFDECVSKPLADSALSALRVTASSFAIEGTPTIIANGWKLPVPPSIDSLRRLARDAAAARPLFVAARPK